MPAISKTGTPEPSAVVYARATVNLTEGSVELSRIACESLEEALGGIGRAFRFLEKRPVTTAYSPENPLLVTTGLLTGSPVMTGLRTYFCAYSPLKCSSRGLPSAIWSAASGKFGSKLKWTGLDELVFEGRSAGPVYALVTPGPQGPSVELKPADDLAGLDTHAKIMKLHGLYPDAHFAVIGPAGENYEGCYMGSVALSTENQLKSGDDKCRFAGRGGMGSLMGYKNLLGIVAQAPDQPGRLEPEIRDLNRSIFTGPGSVKFRELDKGGTGGTWSNYEPLHKVHVVPQNNFRPPGDDTAALMFRSSVEPDFVIRAESCYRCGINCHKNVYRKNPDGSQGEFLAKFDYEPVNLLSTNMGIHDAALTADLIRLVDNLGMDNISLGTTISYVMDYNARHPEKPLFNGVGFGDHSGARELIEQAGSGRLPDIGRGLKRLSEGLGETAYAMQIKGLELPAYIPDSNPGYPWAIAGGHMSMATFMLLALTG
ncbi:MAG: aldehyde:ferredoxin oxidoreductase, partial [Deltaproteobacteria bacterium]|nr:aldehyde:ferredoxin oxidoreductase [Deltaproteobacteria bacterium]